MTLAIHIANVTFETKTLFYTYLTLLPKIRKSSPSVSQPQLQAHREGVLLPLWVGGVGEAIGILLAPLSLQFACCELWIIISISKSCQED